MIMITTTETVSAKLLAGTTKRIDNMYTREKYF